MKIKHQFVLVVLFIILLGSCGFVQEEVGSINIEELTRNNEDLKVFKSSPIYFEKGDKLYFWSDLDIEYEGDLKLYFEVQIVNSKKEILTLIKLNPLDIDTRVMCTETTLNKTTNYSCTGRIHNFLTPEGIDFIDFEDSGEYSFNVIMWASSDENLEIKNARLLMKR